VKLGYRVLPIAPVKRAQDSCVKNTHKIENCETHMNKKTLLPLPHGGKSNISRKTREIIKQEKRDVKELELNSTKPCEDELNGPFTKQREHNINSRAQVNGHAIPRTNTKSIDNFTSRTHSPLASVEGYAHLPLRENNSIIMSAASGEGDAVERQPTTEEQTYVYKYNQERNLPQWQDPRFAMSFSPSVEGSILAGQQVLPFGMYPYPYQNRGVTSLMPSIPTVYGGVPIMYTQDHASPVYQGAQFPIQPLPSQQQLPYLPFIQRGNYYQPAAFVQQAGIYKPNKINLPLTTENLTYFN
jgi:hypothetical protein